MSNKNPQKPTKTETFSYPTEGRREDLKLDKKLEQSNYNSETYQEVNVPITLPTKTKNRENLKQDPGLKKPTKSKTDAPLNDLKKPTDQEDTGALISQVQTRDVGTQTENFETETQGVETQIEPSPRQPIVMPRQKSLLLPNRFEKVKREKIKNPSFSPEVDKPLSESKTAPLPEEAIDSGITYRAKANKEGIIIEEPSGETRTDVESHNQTIGVRPTETWELEKKTTTGIWAGLLLVLAVVLFTTGKSILFLLLNFVNSVLSTETTEEKNKNKDKDKDKENECEPSFFVRTYLSGGRPILEQWMFATRDLPDIDKKIKTGMIGKVVCIVDQPLREVILEFIVSENFFVDSKGSHIHSFLKLSKEKEKEVVQKLETKKLK